MQKSSLILCFSLICCPLFIGCSGQSETQEVEVSAYDSSVDARMEERAKEQMSEADRRKSQQ